jgi:hypothetical protein
MRQISDRSPQPPVVSSARPPLVEPSALRRRSSSPPSRPLAADIEDARAPRAASPIPDAAPSMAQRPVEDVSPAPAALAPPIERSEARQRVLLALTVVVLGAAVGAMAWLFGADLLHP